MTGSRFLDSLPDDLRQTINADLDRVTFHRGDTLLTAGRKFDFIYFPITCLASMIVSLEKGNSVEAATVGNDGFVGVSAFLGMERADITTVIQIDGEAYRLRIDDFRRHLDDQRFHKALGAFAAKTLATIAQSAACNAFHPVQERLARWLLLVRDSTERSELALTQDFIAVMLGVHRPTVTIAIRILESAGLIEHRRSLVRIVDGDALVQAACECYLQSGWERSTP